MQHLFKNRFWVIAAHVVVTVFFALQLPKAQLDNDVANFIPVDHPSRAQYIQAEEDFGGQMLMLVALKVPKGSMLTAENLRILNKVTHRLEEVRFVDRVLSLTNIKDVTVEQDTISVRPIVDVATLDSASQGELQQRLDSWEIYKNSVISADKTAVQLVVQIQAALAETDQRDPKVVVYESVRDILSQEVPAQWQVYISGTPVFAVLMSKSMQLDLIVLVPIVVVVLILTLLVTLRKPSAVVLTLLTVIEATVWSLGLMAFFEIKLTLLATVIPVIMVAVGSAYAIHVISHVLHDQGAFPNSSFQDFLIQVLKLIRKPVLLAALTTVAGFGSLAVTEILPVRYFGIFACFGVFAATLSALTLVPCLLLMIPPQSTNEEHKTKDHLTHVLVSIFNRLHGRPKTVLLVWGLILVLSVVFSARLIVDNALVEFFNPKSEVALSDQFLRTEFAGTKTFSLVFEGPEPGSLTDPRILTVMDETTQHLEQQFSYFGKALGFHHFIKRMNQVFFESQPPSPITTSDSTELAPLGFELEELPPLGFDSAETQRLDQHPPTPKTTNNTTENFYEIPLLPEKYGRRSQEELKGIISNYLFLLGDSTRGLVNDSLEPSKARINFQLRTTGNIQTEEVKTEALRFAQERLPEGYHVKAVGVGLVEKAITDLIVSTQILNILQSLVAVFVILSFSYRSLSLGLLGLIPLALALPINFGLMGLLGIKLNIATSMVSSIAIGVGIDYTIHFLDALRRSAAHHTNWQRIVQHALLTSGKAIVVNALSVGLGFLVLLFSQFQPLISLGALIALTMATTSLASLTALPALIHVFRLQRQIGITIEGGQ